MTQKCTHFINGAPRQSNTNRWLDVFNPATGAVLAAIPMATADDVDEAVRSAHESYLTWNATPVVERARVLFRFKRKLEDHFDALAELIVIDNGKTLAEAKGSIQRGIEVVEFATGIPTHSMGTVVEDIADGIDCEMVRQPLGVVAGLTPFNFPVMVPLWMIPIALACGNTFVLKPSERAPLAAVRLAELFVDCGAPAGTFNVLLGARESAEALISHPGISAVSVVGSSPVARLVYKTAAAHGKRVQALGGAKNSLIVLPDADLDATVESVMSSVFGCAGQRCLAGSNVVAVDNVARELVERLEDAASRTILGSGLEPTTTMGPVISRDAKKRVLGYIEDGLRQGAKLVHDGREAPVDEHPDGFFVGPSVFEAVDPNMAIARDEIFGPVLNVLRAADLDAAIDLVNASPFGNSASLYTTSGGAARRFRKRIEVGMLGINLGVPAPSPLFPFSGWKGSFYGDLHAQGKDAIEFYTRRKVVTSRWE